MEREAEWDEGGLVDVEMVPITFLAGCHVTAGDGLVHFTGWQSTGGEKRIVVRTVLSEHAARQIVQQINRMLPPQN